VCHVHHHQSRHQSSKLGCNASASGGRHHHGNESAAASGRRLPPDVDSKTVSGRAMTSSTGPLDDGVESRTEDHLMPDDGQEQPAAAADNDDAVWIARSPCNSAANAAATWRYRHTADLARRQPVPEAHHPDGDVNRRRRRKRKKMAEVDDATSGCHRARALLAWKLAIVEWRAMSAVIDRLLFVIFLVATVLVYLVVLVIVPTMKSDAA